MGCEEEATEDSASYRPRPLGGHRQGGCAPLSTIDVSVCLADPLFASAQKIRARAGCLP
jgi:hypothetical protein